MYLELYEVFSPLVSPSAAAPLTVLVYLLLVALLCVLLRFLLQLILLPLTRQMAKRSGRYWPSALLRNKLPQRLSNLAIPIVITLTADGSTDPYGLITRAAGLSAVIVLVLFLNAAVRSINDIYEQFEISKIRPIKALLQVVQVVVVILCGVAGLAVLLGENPLLMVGGIGAFAAVISFIFKDPILGFAAGIQLTANNMVRIGDWIEMPKYSLNGDVVEISMTTVKVQNFDQTITSVPSQALVNDAFVNWRGMQEVGGRRIMRSLRLHAGSVRLCEEAMLAGLEQIDLLRPYLRRKREELAAQQAEEDGSAPQATLNTRHLTNLGCFRAYMAHYLEAHPGIHHEMTCMVRQLAAEGSGIPLEVYAFAATIVWEEYENIQADIFDHFYSAAPLFGLEVYQSPSGSDIRACGGAEAPR